MTKCVKMIKDSNECMEHEAFEAQNSFENFIGILRTTETNNIINSTLHTLPVEMTLRQNNKSKRFKNIFFPIRSCCILMKVKKSKSKKNTRKVIAIYCTALLQQFEE